ncbi:MAG: 3-phenylpropionate/cinnamic acid dioxygenase subunit beta [Alphaproteobacteria bacterium]
MRTDRRTALERLFLQREIEEFLSVEAELLDARRFEDWLVLLAPDIRYWMPMMRNVHSARGTDESTREQADANWMDEGIETLTQRIRQLATGIHWAEEPVSRTTHMVSNVRLLDIRDGTPCEVDTSCRFLVYRNRQQDEADTFIGKRLDTLRQTEDGWRLARREIRLDQNVLLAKNLTTFF